MWGLVALVGLLCHGMSEPGERPGKDPSPQPPPPGGEGGPDKAPFPLREGGGGLGSSPAPPSFLGKGVGGLGSSVPQRFEFESKHMGTTFRVVLYAPDAATAKKAADA